MNVSSSSYWVPIVLAAAVAQTARNAAQRSLVESAGTWAATLARFLYGLPVAVFWLVVLYTLTPSRETNQTFTHHYVGWLLLGAVGQLLATAAMLVAMSQRNFVVGSAYAKTDALQVVVFGTILLGEKPTLLVSCAVIVATVGILLLSISRANATAAWLNPAATFGIASGAAFAISTVGYRGAALQLGATSPWLAGAWGVVLAQAIQSVLLVCALAVKRRQALLLMVREWRVGLIAGGAGAAASIGWFTALALTTATNVRALGMVEVVLSYFVSRRLLKEKVSGMETAGLVLVFVGLITLCLR